MFGHDIGRFRNTSYCIYLYSFIVLDLVCVMLQATLLGGKRVSREPYFKNPTTPYHHWVNNKYLKHPNHIKGVFIEEANKEWKNLSKEDQKSINVHPAPRSASISQADSQPLKPFFYRLNGSPNNTDVLPSTSSEGIAETIQQSDSHKHQPPAPTNQASHRSTPSPVVNNKQPPATKQGVSTFGPNSNLKEVSFSRIFRLKCYRCLMCHIIFCVKFTKFI